MTIGTPKLGRKLYEIATNSKYNISGEDRDYLIKAMTYLVNSRMAFNQIKDKANQLAQDLDD